MKILMSALACEPGKGSELEVGFRAVLAAAAQHDVWVLTNADTIPAVLKAIEGRPEAARIHLEGVDFGVDEEGIGRLTVPGFHLYYDRWQRRAASRAVELDSLVDFDVVHHVTLATYWTRAGVAVLDKPLVWGPVGGGVEAPIRLLRELGWRGLVEDAGRVIARRLLARFGPARRAQRRAVVSFAQNGETLRKMGASGSASIMTNATVVELRSFPLNGIRTRDVYFVGRLVPWKGPMLALRSFRYVQTTGARLIFCGDGSERKRMHRAAERWGISDRVRFEGWLPREKLLSHLATAGALLHPALHEEAGLCIAEGLALGTPAVCLDHGGPAEILRQWPDTPSVAVAPDSPQATARQLALAIDKLLVQPPPLRAVPRRSATSFDREILSAYEYAARMRRNARRNLVWAFPRGKPQLFTDSPEGLAKGVTVYGFGRRFPPLLQRAVSLQARLPVIRRLVSERRLPPQPVCGWEAWDSIAATLRERNPAASGEWLLFSSQWEKQRSNALGLNPRGEPEVFLTVEPLTSTRRGPLSPVSSFRVPACTDVFRHEGWLVRAFEVLPRFHRPVGWDPERIKEVAADVPRALTGALERPPEIPPHWLPIHGDLVPWNLREDDHGQLWLVDWEDAGWGPPLTDLVRYIVAYQSLGRTSPARIAVVVKATLETESDDALVEVAKFWLQHPNLQPIRYASNLPRAKAHDLARTACEVAALRALATTVAAPVLPTERRPRP